MSGFFRDELYLPVEAFTDGSLPDLFAKQLYGFTNSYSAIVKGFALLRRVGVSAIPKAENRRDPFDQACSEANKATITSIFSCFFCIEERPIPKESDPYLNYWSDQGSIDIGGADEFETIVTCESYQNAYKRLSAVFAGHGVTLTSEVFIRLFKEILRSCFLAPPQVEIEHGEDLEGNRNAELLHRYINDLAGKDSLSMELQLILGLLHVNKVSIDHLSPDDLSTEVGRTRSPTLRPRSSASFGRPPKSSLSSPASSPLSEPLMGDGYPPPDSLPVPMMAGGLVVPGLKGALRGRLESGDDVDGLATEAARHLGFQPEPPATSCSCWAMFRSKEAKEQRRRASVGVQLGAFLETPATPS